jgi:hypothetical protein
MSLGKKGSQVIYSSLMTPEPRFKLGLDEAQTHVQVSLIRGSAGAFVLLSNAFILSSPGGSERESNVAYLPWISCRYVLWLRFSALKVLVGSVCERGKLVHAIGLASWCYLSYGHLFKDGDHKTTAFSRLYNVIIESLAHIPPRKACSNCHSISLNSLHILYNYFFL